MSKVIIGMSGGVDSSVAAALLKKSGYDVIGVTMKLFDSGCCSNKAESDAKRVAEKLDIPFYVIDCKKEFEENVISDFINEYKNGHTPNPCVICNKKLKFDAMLKSGMKLGAEYVATGHYAKIEEKDGRYLLMRSADRHKDQTYFLYTLNQYQLSHTIMPLSGMTKDDTRKIAEELGLDVAKKKDSQEICFIPDGNYADFIEERTGKCPKGDFVDDCGNIVGKHNGIIRYTVGQRKGLGIALGRPVFVSRIDAVNNRVYLGDNGCQLNDTLYAENLNFIPFDNLTETIRCTAKIRYNAREAVCTVTPYNDGVKVVFDEPQKSITPGQSVVFYDGDTVIGGGIIKE